MEGFGKWAQALFTPEERVALAFLVAVSLAGLALIGWERVRPEPGAPIKVELRIRINSASAEELSSLPGIGPVTARRIVEHRKRHGSFLTLADLKRVKGISAKALARMKGHLKFD